MIACCLIVCLIVPVQPSRALIWGMKPCVELCMFALTFTLLFFSWARGPPLLNSRPGGSFDSMSTWKWPAHMSTTGAQTSPGPSSPLQTRWRLAPILELRRMTYGLLYVGHMWPSWPVCGRNANLHSHSCQSLQCFYPKSFTNEVDYNPVYQGKATEHVSQRSFQKLNSHLTQQTP